MREQEFVRLHQQSQRRNALIVKQFEFMQTRQEAWETLVKVSRLRDRLRWLLNPLEMVTAVDNVQSFIMAKRAETMREQAEKAKIVVPSHNLVPGVRL